MKLIVDSGSSKADWAICTASETIYISTLGINPSTQQMSYMNDIIRSVFIQLDDVPDTIIHYGAGCSSLEAVRNLKEAYRCYFPLATIYTQTDLLGACRAACQGQAGIVCILGTGSHAALSDGHSVIHQMPSLGFILGDEGSGTHLAKTLIQAYFLKKWDEPTMHLISQHFKQFETDFVYEFYQSNEKVHILSKIAHVIINQKDSSWAQQIIRKCFQSFIDLRLRRYESENHLPVHGIGSVAYLLQEEFRLCLLENHFQAGQILRKPIEALTHYHKKYEIN